MKAIAWPLVGPESAMPVARATRPLIPAIQPDNPGVVSETVAGTLVHDMPSYYAAVTGTYYFPGMYTVVLPVLPAVVFIWIVLRGASAEVASG